MEELGMAGKATTHHRGGETLALARLDKIIADEPYTATFEKPRTAPTAFSPASTTVLSPHLHFGSLSCRTFYWAVQDVVDRYNSKGQGKQRPTASKPPTSLTGQLLFRDMYFGAQASLGYRFAQTIGNSHCRFVPWHLPSMIDPGTGLATGEYHVDTPLAEMWFQRWKYGRTGFPFIDGLMRQLRQEGWIHHLGRHAVASFLTRGGCYIDWMRGADVFEEWLLDHEVSCNIGNWQWLSCTAFYALYFRVYSPVAFPAKWDPTGEFVRRYVPELQGFPKKYIYEPWRCPVRDQKIAGCLIKNHDEIDYESDKGHGGGNGQELQSYPKPMFDFPTRRSVCIEGIKTAYRVGLYGNDPRVLNGTWRGLFDDDAEGPTEDVFQQPQDQKGGDHDLDLDRNGPGDDDNGRQAQEHTQGFTSQDRPEVDLDRDNDLIIEADEGAAAYTEMGSTPVREDDDDGNNNNNNNNNNNHNNNNTGVGSRISTRRRGGVGGVDKRNERKMVTIPRRRQQPGLEKSTATAENGGERRKKEVQSTLDLHVSASSTAANARRGDDDKGMTRKSKRTRIA